MLWGDAVVISKTDLDQLKQYNYDIHLSYFQTKPKADLMLEIHVHGYLTRMTNIFKMYEEFVMHVMYYKIHSYIICMHKKIF